MPKDKKIKRRFGDRREGRRLRTLDPYNAMMPFLMKEKSGASNYFSDMVEISEVEKFLRSKRKQGYPGMGLLHIMVAIYLRVVAQYPAINRFCSGQRIYARNNVEFIMTVKKKLTTEGSETSIKVILDPSETINDVYRKLSEHIDMVKSEGSMTSTDNVANTLVKLPRVLLKFTVGLLSLLDYFGIMPKSILEASPFHGSVIITDLGSVGLPAIYHHLYNFGNLPIFIALGAKKKVRELDINGNVNTKKYIDYKLVVDERICDGFYFSQAFKVFKDLLRNPEKLDIPPEKVTEDIY